MRPAEPIAPPGTQCAAPVLELYASIQGEGLYVGQPQVFLRLAGCPLRCAWCDTPRSWTLGAGATWTDACAAARRVAELDPLGARPLSATGGEPLLWPAFLLELRAEIGARALHLETAGAHPRALARVVGRCDHVSLDLKLPADLAPPVELALRPGGPVAREEESEAAPRDAREWRRARRACLELVAGRDACAKIVVAGGRAPDVFLELLDDAAELAPDLPLVLQPATPTRAVAAPAVAVLERLAEAALARGLRPRVLPQVHRALGVE